MDPVRLRLLSQQLAAPQFSEPEEVVAHFGAMQAQEYRLMRWAVAMRTRKPSADAFRRAFDGGQILRTHLLRGTWQLVSARDYGWMMELCAPKAERVIRGWMSANGISLPADEVVKVRDLLLQATDELGSATKEDFVQALAAKGVVMDDHRLSYHIRYAELSGDLCSGNLLPMKATYSLAEGKVARGRAAIERKRADAASDAGSGAASGGGNAADGYSEGATAFAGNAADGYSAGATAGAGSVWAREAMSVESRPAERDEALMMLARKYFKSHSPATFEDFVWWAGMNVGDCRKGIALLGAELEVERWRGYEFYVHESCRRRGFRSGSALLLASYDEYLIGYKSREIVLPPEFSARAHNNSGNFYPIVARDGVVCGNWAPFAQEMAVRMFGAEASEGACGAEEALDAEGACGAEVASGAEGASSAEVASGAEGARVGEGIDDVWRARWDEYQRFVRNGGR